MKERVNERDVWQGDRVKLCRAQQSCSKRGESGRVLDRGIRHTEYHTATTVLLNNKWSHQYQECLDAAELTVGLISSSPHSQLRIQGKMLINLF